MKCDPHHCVFDEGICTWYSASLIPKWWWFGLCGNGGKLGTDQMQCPHKPRSVYHLHTHTEAQYDQTPVQGTRLLWQLNVGRCSEYPTTPWMLFRTHRTCYDLVPIHCISRATQHPWQYAISFRERVCTLPMHPGSSIYGRVSYRACI